MTNPCKTCNASHKNTVERVIRCCTCVVQIGKMPTNHQPIETAHGIKGDA